MAVAAAFRNSRCLLPSSQPCSCTLATIAHLPLRLQCTLTMSSAASESLLLERVRRVCRQLPASECPEACGLMLAMEKLKGGDTLLLDGIEAAYCSERREEVPPSGRAASGPVLHAESPRHIQGKLLMAVCRLQDFS